MGIVFLFTFFKTPGEITSMLLQVTQEQNMWAIIMHGIYLVFVLVGIMSNKLRNIAFSMLMLLLSASATVFSLLYMIYPNVIIFLTFFILTLIAWVRKELDFQFSGLPAMNKVFGGIALVFAFYYLHWIDSPIWINALVYSPLGIVNCPTMLAFCGLICFLKSPGAKYLQFFVAFVTLYFGFFGIMRLGAYIDVVLIGTALYIILQKFSLQANVPN
jgi:hypothetical protein